MSEGDFIDLNGEYLKVIKPPTLLVNRFDEEIYILNLKFLLGTFRKPYTSENMRYIEVRFDMPYNCSLKQVEGAAREAAKHYNAQHRDMKIKRYRSFLLDFANHSVIYERLRQKEDASMLSLTHRRKLLCLSCRRPSFRLRRRECTFRSRSRGLRI